jgi:hypothetical protein
MGQHDRFRVLSATPLTYSLRRHVSDSGRARPGGAKPEGAEAFAERFGGKRLPTGSRR